MNLVTKCLPIWLPPYCGFPGGTEVKNPRAMQQTQVQYLCWENPLEKETAIYSIFLPEKSHGQKSLVGESTRDEANFPFIGSLALPCSTPYSTSGLTSFRKLQRFLGHPSQAYMNINFSTAQRGQLHAPHIVARWELISCLWLKGEPTFHKQLKWSFPSAIGMLEGP